MSFVILKRNRKVSALTCLALFSDCLLKKYLTSILPSSKCLFQKNLCVRADDELLSKIMCCAVSEYFFKSIWDEILAEQFPAIQQNVIVVGTKILETRTNFI